MAKREIPIDEHLCDRFMIALRSCFSDNSGSFKQDIAEQSLSNLDKTDLPAIQRHEKEPSKVLLLEVLEKCDAFTPEWLLGGKIDMEVSERILNYMSKNRLDPLSVARETGTTKEFFAAMRDHAIMPSERFVIRFCATYSVSLEEIIKR